MKNTYKSLFYLSLLILAIFLTGCESTKEDTLPPITTKGANTMGCLIDGEVFIADQHGMFDVSLSADYIKDYLPSSNQSVFVRGHGKNGFVSFQFTDNVISKNSSYVLNDSLINYGNLYDNKELIEYYTNSENVGEVSVLKLDTINWIISGTFWFDAINKDGKLVKIREGRFDVVY